MRVLFITQHNPYGTRGGGVIASHAYLRAFSELFDGNIDLVCADSVKNLPNNDPSDIRLNNVFYAPKRSKIKKFMSIFNGHLNRYTEFVTDILRRIRYDIVIFDHSSTGGSLVDMVHNSGAKIIAIHHNYEKEYFSDNASPLNKTLFLRHVVNHEKKMYLNSSLNLFLSEYDLKTFEKVYGQCGGQNRLIGVFSFKNENSFVDKRQRPQSQGYIFAITGSLNNYQTTDGIKYFFKELYSCIPTDSQVLIAGKNPSKDVIALCSQHTNVTLIPNPESMEAVLSKADIYICPTKIGGGVKLRVLDGLRAGMPVISHVVSARGYECFYGNAMAVFCDSDSFRQSLNTIINKVQSNELDCKNVVNLYVNNYGFESGRKRLLKILADVNLL